MGTRYAEGTQVSVERSKIELRDLLRKYGAIRVIDISDTEKGDAVQFELRGHWFRFQAQRPGYQDYRTIKGRWQTRTDAEAKKKAEQEYMRRWRALILLVKAKFEAVMDEQGEPTGDADFESEFFGYVLLPDGSTTGDHAQEGLDAIYSGAAPPSVRALLGLSSENNGKE